MTPYIAPGLSIPERNRFLSTRISTEAMNINIDNIIRAVSICTGISYDDMKSTKRKREIVEARQMAMSVIRKETTVHFHQIAKLFKRDHSTVIYGINTMSDLIETSAVHRTMLTAIERTYQELKSTL